MFDSHDGEIWVGTGFWLCSGFCIDKMYEYCHDFRLTPQTILELPECGDLQDFCFK